MALKRGILVGVFLLVATAVCLLWMTSTGDGESVNVQDAEIARRTSPSAMRPSEGRVSERIRRPKSVRSRRTDAKPKLVWNEEEEEDTRTPAEKALAERIDKALDDEDFESAVACAVEALSCRNTEIRQAMVDTLGWFGARALPELTPFMVDDDEDVRQSAQNEWSMALSDIEDDGEKVDAVEMAMQALTDEDFLEEISGEYIGIDEKLAVESLLRIIEGSGTEKGIAKAKETYEFVTGEEFTNRADAEKWLAEEYQPPTEND